VSERTEGLLERLLETLSPLFRARKLDLRGKRPLRSRRLEGFLVTLFITVRKVARSRDFYSRVLGGTVVLEANPCIVKLSNSRIIMNPGGALISLAGLTAVPRCYAPPREPNPGNPRGDSPARRRVARGRAARARNSAR
jgi:hypothetical protein